MNTHADLWKNMFASQILLHPDELRNWPNGQELSLLHYLVVESNSNPSLQFKQVVAEPKHALQGARQAWHSPLTA